jgi:hypothetical protein
MTETLINLGMGRRILLSLLTACKQALIIPGQ